MNLKKLEVIEIDINKIREYANNAKEHPEWHVTQIKESIKKFGFIDPIAVNKDLQIIAGHGRLMAAKELKMDKIPCIVLSGMTEAEEKAYIIAHNKLTMNTGFDLEKLSYELNSLKIENVDLKITGFNELELQNILDGNELFDNSDYSGEDLKNEYKEPSKKLICPNCNYRGESSEFKKEE